VCSTGHEAILTRELEAVGIRLNQRPPDVYLKVKKTVRMSHLRRVTHPLNA
jgi:ribosome-interacting GTPase 1